MFSRLVSRRRNSKRQTQQAVATAAAAAAAAAATPNSASRVLPPPRPTYEATRHAIADFTEADDNDDDSHEEDEEEEDDERGRHEADYDDDGEHDENDDDHENDFENEERQRRQSMPVLPLFSTTYLDSLPIYHITHAIRVIVSSRTETTLTWDQLRSPQVSRFLVKPMQQQIRASHFSRATLYALMANCLQFAKEAQLYPGNAGTSNTRAKVCELLATKLLKEYTTRELIDALSYDFYPLQGSPSAPPDAALTRRDTYAKKAARIASRTSTLEVAIRASAKNFLAHPLVVQQLEAIWSGAITFYSAADSLHRDNASLSRSPSTSTAGKTDVRTPLLNTQRHQWRRDHRQQHHQQQQQHYHQHQQHQHQQRQPHSQAPSGRRTVALYDPRQASLLKLSRLRVPRYRFFFGTLSLAVLIVLFLAVCWTRSPQITSLELVFWFWSAGFMLDELVGFNEQGFALYLMSPWNLIDLGILMLLIIYYCMRAYGVFLVDPHHWNSMAYDVLAANAILLLPRIFSVLDHYRYFSQLLIAFRLMAVDLAAVLILVLISCSGFFVFFTMSKSDSGGGDVAYQIFQILMGYTPAAWERWPSYSGWEKCIMVLFLIICHFVVVTILITVLTNSFMKIASNANNEHQFLFAVNTISMVKNDALFSYIAPSNIFAWLLMPLRYCLPLKHFVWLNRTIIKATHFPLLFCIFLYEKYWLATSIFEPTDLVEYGSSNRHGRGGRGVISFVDPASRSLFSPNVLVREESVAGFQKDRALEEVFRRMPGPKALKTQRRQQRRKQTDIRNWMDQAEVSSPPPLAQWSTIGSRVASANHDWSRRYSYNPEKPVRPRHISDARSTASDPANTHSVTGAPHHPPPPLPRYARRFMGTVPEAAFRDLTDIDADGDDELVTNDEDEEEQATNAGEEAYQRGLRSFQQQQQTTNDGDDENGDNDDYFSTPMASKFSTSSNSNGNNNLTTSSVDFAERPQAVSPPGNAARDAARKSLHSRTMSSNTILFNPQTHADSAEAGPVRADIRPTTARNNTVVHGLERRQSSHAMRPRPIVSRGGTEMVSSGNRSLFPFDGHTSNNTNNNTTRSRHAKQRQPSTDVSVTSDNVNRFDDDDDDDDDAANVLSSSFQTQMAMALMEKNSRLLLGSGGGIIGIGDGDGGGRRSGSDAMDATDRLSKLVLSRIGQMEQSLADVARELRGMREGGASASASASTSTGTETASGLSSSDNLDALRGHERKKSRGARRGGVRERLGGRRGSWKGKEREEGKEEEEEEEDREGGDEKTMNSA